MLFDSLLGTPAVAPFLTLKRAKIENRDYDVEFPLRWMQKDMHLTTVSAYETGVAMPLTNVAKEVYRLAMRDELGTDDFSVVYEFVTANGPASPTSVPLSGNPRRPNEKHSTLNVQRSIPKGR
jgi:3-hydroxyisobutyrate dehydrogenase/glyoxylate/succinic semialdehyde reductase